MPRHDDPTPSPTDEIHGRTAELPNTGMTTPVETARLDFYDTGGWVPCDGGEQVFFP